MATLVFSGIGTALGGPLGGAMGAFAGRQVDAALLGGRSRSGARLRELDLSLSSYGQAIPRLYGRMRVAGAIIWATELQEHSEVHGSKGQPGTTYGYAANLAVVVSSRPISGIGRIWADGKLLRGAAGDLKAGGILRVYTGTEEQAPDPLIAASEGEDRCPAFRGLAYVVFEGLELADFGNRIPAVTFEVLADDAVRLNDILGDTLDRTSVPHEITGLAGFAVEDSVATALTTLDPVLPIALDAAGDPIRVHVAREPVTPIPLDEAALTANDDGFSPAEGVRHHSSATQPQAPPVLRYCDVDRDYQPSVQHAAGRPGPGQPFAIELPAALTAGEARALVERMARVRERSRESIAWRTCTLDPAVAPGALVQVPGRRGAWRVESWEWRDTGIELELVRQDSLAAAPVPLPGAQPFTSPTDLPTAHTQLVALELPWDGESSAADRPRLYAAVGATGPNWSGAALYADRGDGQMWPLGASGRRRAVVGMALDGLAPASPLLLDRSSRLTVALAAPDMVLGCASLAELTNGANLALIGNELVQFARAEPLGDGRWRISQLLRGCAGTDGDVAGHVSGEAFALLDAQLTPLDLASLGTMGQATEASVIALGRGDAEPVISRLHLSGITARPLAPVHARTALAADGSLHLGWTRRARGGWAWRDGVDVPLGEETERYLVTYEAQGSQLRAWSVTRPALALSAADLGVLRTLAADGVLHVRQQGTRALSHPLLLARLP